MGGLELVDTMIKDGLTDVFNGYHMGITAENLAEQYQMTRDAQDAFAAASQQKASAARAEGRFADEIAPVTVKGRKGDTIVDQDEYIRDGVERRRWRGCGRRSSKDGTVTAGNASGLNDGAAALVVMRADEAERRGATVLARIASWASAGVDPSIMGIGPVPATAAGAGESRLDDRRPRPDRGQRGVRGAGAGGRQGARLGRGQGQRQRRRHRHRPPDRRVGRAGADHPALRDGAAATPSKGLATLCIGGGMGIAVCVER